MQVSFDKCACLRRAWSATLSCVAQAQQAASGVLPPPPTPPLLHVERERERERESLCVCFEVAIESVD